MVENSEKSAKNPLDLSMGRFSIRRPRGRRLTPIESEQIDTAIAFAVKNGISSYVLSKRLNITATALVNRAVKMGLRFRSSRFWTIEELEILREMAPLHTAREIAEELDRTHNEIRQQANYRGIEFRKVRS